MIAGLAILAFAIALIVGMRAVPARSVQLSLVGDSLELRIRGKDFLYALCRRLIIPTDAVEGVGVFPVGDVPREGWRVGSALPGVIRAGWFILGQGQRDFWLVRSPEQVLVIELALGSDIRRIVLELPDPRAEAVRLRPDLGFLTELA